MRANDLLVATDVFDEASDKARIGKSVLNEGVMTRHIQSSLLATRGLKPNGNSAIAMSLLLD
jgi:hypothetical protein